MNTSGTPPRGRAPKLSSHEAQARLADALRENLKRRKAQVRARGAQKEHCDESGEDEGKPGGKSR